jgi:hypothetical protein
MSTGTWLEPTIAAWFETHCDPNENLEIRMAGLFASAERPWQLATPDRLIFTYRDCGGQCDELGLLPDDTFCITCQTKGLGAVLECKWVAYSWDGFGDDNSGDVPVHYRAQALWQMDVMEVGEVFLCALGPGGFRMFRIRRDDKDLAAMREAGRRFMESLAEGIPPDVDDHSATLPIVKRINEAIEDREQEIPAHIAAGWLRAKRFKALADQVERRYSANLRAHLGTAKTAIWQGEVIAARTSADQLRRKA